jgi:hypothetical protein
VAQFPTNLVAGTFGFRPGEFFGWTTGERRRRPWTRAEARGWSAVQRSCASDSLARAEGSLLAISVRRRHRRRPDGVVDVSDHHGAVHRSWNGSTGPSRWTTAPQGFNWTLDLELVGASLEGRALEVERERVRHFVKYKIWIPGARDTTRTVVLRYRARNGLRFFEDHDELYWNVTGDEWDVPIGAASARITLPAGGTGIRATAFNGVYGATAQDAEVVVEGSTVRVNLPGPLGFYEGLTAVVGWDKGLVAEPTAGDRVRRFLASNWALAIPIPVFLVMLALWRRVGRDPRRLPVAVRYEPPDALTPAEAGTLMDYSADMRDITATLVDLAVRGHLRIEEREESALLGLMTKREYLFHRLTPPADAPPLGAHESRMLGGCSRPDVHGEALDPTTSSTSTCRGSGTPSRAPGRTPALSLAAHKVKGAGWWARSLGG